MELNGKKIVKNTLTAGAVIGLIASGCALLEISLKIALKVFDKSEAMIDKIMDEMFEITDKAEIVNKSEGISKTKGDISADQSSDTSPEAAHTSKSHYRDFVIEDVGNGTFKFDDGNNYYELNGGSLDSVHEIIDIIIDTKSTEECCEESEEAASVTDEQLIDLSSIPTTPWNADLN